MSNVSGVVNLSAAAAIEPGVRGGSGTAAAARVSGSGVVDQAVLSSTGGLLSSALAYSDVRLEKVAALQQTIAAGTYKVSAGDVAEKLIASLLN